MTFSKMEHRGRDIQDQKKKNVLKLNGKYTCIHTYVKYNFVWQKKLQEDYM